jgi:hypothetical protein
MLNIKNKPSTTSNKSKNDVIIPKNISVNKNNSNFNNNYLLQQSSPSNSITSSSTIATPSSYSSYSQQQQFFAKLQATQSPTSSTETKTMHPGSTKSRGHVYQPSPSIGPSPNTKFLLSDFAICRTLGTGSFGRVHLVQSKYNNRFYAMKVLKKSEVVRLKQVEHTNNEKNILEQVQHPFLVNLWGTFQDSANLYMVMDYVVGGELFSILRKNQVREDD